MVHDPHYVDMLLHLIDTMSEEERENLEDRAYMQWLKDHPEPYVEVPEAALEDFAAFDAWITDHADDSA